MSRIEAGRPPPSPPKPPPSPTSPSRGQLGLFDAVSIIIGIIIGATIYETPPYIFQLATDHWIALGLWAAGGVLAFIGALCYAELATTYPRSGGDYNYLTRAYGPLGGYLFGWAQLAIVQTASIGLMAYIFGHYLVRYVQLTNLWEFESLEVANVTIGAAIVYASAAVVFLTLLNAVGVVLGKVAQNVLTAAKIIGLGGIMVAGFVFAAPDQGTVRTVRGQVKSASAKQVVITDAQGDHTFTVPPKATIIIDDKERHQDPKTKKDVPNKANLLQVGADVRVVAQPDAPGQVAQIRAIGEPSYAGIALAMVIILLAYGGYNDAAFVAAEVRDRRRNLPRALFIGTLGVMVIYLLVNAAYIRGLGPERAAESKTIASDTLRLVPGEVGAYGEQIMCILVMISALGAVNGLIFTSSRIYATLGADYSLFSGLSRWTRGGGSPIWSLLLSMVITLAMLFVVGTAKGRELLNEGFQYLGVAPVGEADWGRGGFEPFLKCSAPIFWLFFLLTGLAVFVLRINDRRIPRAFSVPLFPITPLIFCAMCGYMLYSSIVYAGRLGLVGGLLVIAGIPLYIFSRRRDALQIVDVAEADKLL